MNNVVALAFLILISACSSNSTNTVAPPASITGVWFYCEFGESDNCMVYDDDGLEFTVDGRIINIEESSQGTLPECGTSPCFNSQADSLVVVRGNLVGEYSYMDGLLEVQLGQCSENISVGGTIPRFSLDNCPAPIDDAATSGEVTLLQLYTGNTSFSN